MRDIIIVGASGHGREVLWLIREMINDGASYRVAGFVDDNPALQGQEVVGVPVLGTLDDLEHQPEAALAMGIGLPTVKAKVMDRLRPFNRDWPPLIAPSARMSPRVEVGEGVTVCAGAVVTTEVRLEAFSLINIGVTLSHDVRVGTYSMVAPGASLAGEVKVGALTSIGTGASVIPRVTIGDGTTIGAGAVVIDDIPDGATAVGVPARRV